MKIKFNFIILPPENKYPTKLTLANDLKYRSRCYPNALPQISVSMSSKIGWSL